MAIKPTVSTEWATDAAALKIEPSEDQKQYGWSTSDNTVSGVPVKPNLQNLNSWQNSVHQWVQYFEAKTDDSLKWYQATTNTNLNVSTARAWFIKNQTAEIVFTIDGSGLQKGDIFHFKNDGPLDYKNNDIHILHVKTSDFAKNLVVWLMAGDSCVIRANKDNPTVTADWDLVELDRPNGLENCLQFTYITNDFGSPRAIRKIIFVPEIGRWFAIREDDYRIYASEDYYGRVWFQVTVSSNNTQNDILYVKEHNLLIITTNNQIIISTNEGYLWTTVFTSTTPNIVLDKIFYLPSIDRISIAITGPGSGFVYSNNGGQTWTQQIASGTSGKGFFAQNDLDGRIFFYAYNNSGYYVSENGTSLISTTPSSLYIFDQDGLEISQSGNFEIQNVFYDQYSKRFVMFFKFDSASAQFKFAYSLNGYEFFIDPILTDKTYTADYTGNRTYCSLPFASLTYTQEGHLYTTNYPNNVRRTNIINYPDYPNPVNFLNGSGYSDRMNRLIIHDYSLGNPDRMMISGRR